MVSPLSVPLPLFSRSDTGQPYVKIFQKYKNLEKDNCQNILILNFLNCLNFSILNFLNFLKLNFQII